MADYSRADRIADQLQREISRMIHEDVKDPRIGMVTISRVDVTRDLQQARVFYSCYGDDEARKASHAGLTRSAGFIRRKLGQLLHIRAIPEIVFVFDPNLDHVERMAEVFRQVAEADRARAAEAASAAEGPGPAPAAHPAEEARPAGDADAVPREAPGEETRP